MPTPAGGVAAKRDDYLAWLQSGGARGRTVSQLGRYWRPQGSDNPTALPGGWNSALSAYNSSGPNAALHNAISMQGAQPRRFTYVNPDGFEQSMQVSQPEYYRHMAGFNAADSARGTYDPITGRITRGVMTMGDTGYRHSVGRSSVLENSSIDFDAISAYQNASPAEKAYLQSMGVRPHVITNIGGQTYDSWQNGGIGSEEETWSTVPMNDIMNKAKSMGFQPTGPSGSWGLQARQFLINNGSLDARTNQWAGTGTLAGSGTGGTNSLGSAIGNSDLQRTAETDQAAVDQMRQRAAASGNTGLINYQEARLRAMLEKGRRQSRLDSLLKEMQLAQMMGQINAPKIYGFNGLGSG